MIGFEISKNAIKCEGIMKESPMRVPNVAGKQLSWADCVELEGLSMEKEIDVSLEVRDHMWRLQKGFLWSLSNDRLIIVMSQGDISCRTSVDVRRRF
ncbi:hypothetical protein Droror1_Dr00000044 [Drosera rotundifolia]